MSPPSIRYACYSLGTYIHCGPVDIRALRPQYLRNAYFVLRIGFLHRGQCKMPRDRRSVKSRSFKLTGFLGVIDICHV